MAGSTRVFCSTRSARTRRLRCFQIWPPRTGRWCTGSPAVCRSICRWWREDLPVLGTEIESGDRPAAILYALAAGRTKYHEIEDAIRAEPSRTLDRLITMRLVERLIPVTDDPKRSKRRIYRIADNFLAFYLGILSHYRAEIDRGLGATIVDALLNDLDDHMGPIYKEAFRDHLRRLAVEGRLGPAVVAVGPWWRQDGQDQLDAVVLAKQDKTRRPVMVRESKWSRQVDAARIRRGLERKATNIADPDELTYAVCARETLLNLDDDVLGVTAADIFTSRPKIRP